MKRKPLANTKRGGQKGGRKGGRRGGGGAMENNIITNYSANIDGIAMKRKPLANTKRGNQKGGKRGGGTKNCKLFSKH